MAVKPTLPLTIVVPCPGQWLNANDRLHHMAQHRIRRQWRDNAYYAAARVHAPKGLSRVRVDVEYVFIGRSPVKEIENLRPTLKAVVDGAIGPKRGTAPGWGVVLDDSDAHLVYGSYTSRIESRVTGKSLLGRVELTVTEVSHA